MTKYTLTTLCRWGKAHPVLFLAWLTAAAILIGVNMSAFFAPPKLETTPFLSLSGTVTFIGVVGEDIYLAQRSLPQGSPFVPLDENDYAEIKRISRNNFFSGKGIPDSVLRVQGAITSGAISDDQKSLYFIWRKMEDGKNKYSLHSFDLATHVVSTLGTYDTFGGHLYNVEGSYLLDEGGVYISATLDKGITWHNLLGDYAGRRSTWVIDGDAYYMLDNDIFHMPKSSILDKTFQATKLYTLEPDIDVGSLFVDAERQIYVTVYNENPPVLFNIGNRSRSPLATSPTNKKYMKATVFFKHGDVFYGTFWAADRPMTNDSVIIKVDGKILYQTEAYSGSPNFLDAVGDYLIFNYDRVLQRKSEIFGVKYK